MLRGGRKKKRKAFSFEKKKQKTFANGGRGAIQSDCGCQPREVLWFILSKKNIFSCLLV
jgi:hypothetical protein